MIHMQKIEIMEKKLLTDGNDIELWARKPDHFKISGICWKKSAPVYYWALLIWDPRIKDVNYPSQCFHLLNFIRKNPQIVTCRDTPPTGHFPSWWHSSTLKHLPCSLFNRMSHGCLILTPKYQLASRMNGLFPFWTNAGGVDSAYASV